MCILFYVQSMNQFLEKRLQCFVPYDKFVLLQASPNEELGIPAVQWPLVEEKCM